MRITKRTNIAMRLLMFCAANSKGLVTKREIAACCNVSENHLAQVINQLGQLGFLATHRGRKGGIALARPASEIYVGQVFRQIEGEVAENQCLADGDQSCPLIFTCRLKNALADAAEAFYGHLDEMSLDTLICGNTDLLETLRPVSCSAQSVEA